MLPPTEPTFELTPPPPATNRNGALRTVVVRRLVSGLVIAVWVALTADLFIRYQRVASPVPLAEDWLMVAPLTGHEPDLAAWFWRQNNEHRLPLARALYLGALYLGNGDVRVQGLINLTMMSALAAGLMLFLRHLRGGRTAFADVFFPALLLHWGNSAQYLFPFLVHLIVPVAGSLILACIALRSPRTLSVRLAWTVGLIVVLMPLSGLPGLLLIGAPVLIFSFTAWAAWNGRAGWARDRRLTWILGLCFAVTAIEVAACFVDYQRPWSPPPVGLRARIETALTVFSYQFGAAPIGNPGPYVVLAAVVWVPTSIMLAIACAKARGAALLRVTALAALIGNAALFPLAIGWSRASWVKDFGVPSRYVIFALPVLVLVFIAWEQWGPAIAKRWVPRLLAVLMLVLLPRNTEAGTAHFAQWYHDGMSALQRDIAAQMPLTELAQKHQRFLIHWWQPAQVEQAMRWLRDAGASPFTQTADPATPSRPPSEPDAEGAMHPTPFGRQLKRAVHLRLEVMLTLRSLRR